ncbi:class II aldolase/adducin family protein [Rhizobium leguminosarum]|uniref:class II aldolase/adducin family protein n=1 Tax=Rhizobium leguminosarum TaxID=384 RepID=UPI00102FC9BF|nr:class II aldolase/adducin family protein [Rhizobium leguminosarum]TAU94797.1 class II aldolase/adducin family protein [Rhizobium leguminosarum]TAV09257.1 class II aldolase/adducin family protein [Rhizobium leguminosarum]TAW50174.1 class II aldolase/adducin family protein [Rhizobium leguminosarum]TAX49044.1 class II aldolase/adducin family protein [Rhizobium leguminosarum]WHO78347.1 class II aldolase/adducin family protein [Rhizobium leguminosarum]
MENNLELREFICEVGRRAYAREMGAANDGNISVLLDDGTLLCTPTGVSKGFMKPEMICHIERSGKPIGDGLYRPSTEIGMHLCVYDHRDDVRSVVHAHPLYATVHAICGKPLTQQIMPESTMFLGEVPLTPYGLPSTPELSDAIIPYLQRHDALLLENHGALTYGHDLNSAYFKMEALDYYAKVVYLAASYGGAKEFNADQIERLLDVRRKHFNQPGRHPFLNLAEQVRQDDH